MTAQAPRFHSREQARAKLTDKVRHESMIRDRMADERARFGRLVHTFTTIDPEYIIADAEWRLRWLDCAPDGANHQLAPMQDKRGVPMGGVYSELVGPCANLREARAARGLCPFSGERLS